MRIVDDPFCVYNTDVNGTEVITYTGYLSKLETPNDACKGFNLRSVNTILITIGLILGFVGVYIALGFLKNRRTPYNLVLVATPVVMIIGLIIELWGAASFFQFAGKPWLGHLPKLFYFAEACGDVFMQGFRIEFILIGAGKSRSWKKYYTRVAAALGTVCGFLFFTCLMIGLVKGVDAQPIGFVFPYAAWLLSAAIIDTILSIWILRITASQALLLSKYPQLTMISVKAFARQNNFAAVGQLIADVLLLSTYIIRNSVADMGYTFSYIAILGLPLKVLMLLLSITVMQKARRAASAAREFSSAQGRSGGTSASRSHFSPTGTKSGLLHPNMSATLVHSSASPSLNLKPADSTKTKGAPRISLDLEKTFSDAAPPSFMFSFITSFLRS
ncbi:hypothetical protein DFS34DRAFT_692723 [Phlyctochytrium arcticum]|nr:hypothetical protein DFS34DRAFT_692723 [Phlyctochytrium arcticum]